MSQSVYSTSYLISPCFWPRNTHYKCPLTKTPCTSQKGKNSNPKSSQKLHKDQVIKYVSTQKTLHDVYQNLEQIWILAFLHNRWFLLQKFWSCLHDTKNTRYLISLFCINKFYSFEDGYFADVDTFSFIKSRREGDREVITSWTFP